MTRTNIVRVFLLLAVFAILTSLSGTLHAQVGTFGAPPPSTGTATKHITLSLDTPPSGLKVNVYRGVQSGGPYGKINATPLTAVACVPVLTGKSCLPDATAQPGVQEFYVVTHVDTSGSESAWSNQGTGMIPASVPTPTGFGVIVEALVKVARAIYATVSWLPRHIFG